MSFRWSRTAKRIRVPMGFLTAAFYIWRAHPSAASLLWSLLLAVPGLLLRAYASGYVKKNAELTVTGPYAYTRNPLYLGSAIMTSGFALASRSWGIALVLAALFALLYLPTIHNEELFLRSKFPGFDEYARRVPRIFPRLTPAASGAGGGDAGFSLALYLQHREYNAALGVCAIYAVLIARFLLRV